MTLPRIPRRGKEKRILRLRASPSAQNDRKRNRPSPFLCHPEQAAGAPKDLRTNSVRRFFDSLRSLRMTCKTGKALKFPLSSCAWCAAQRISNEYACRGQAYRNSYNAAKSKDPLSLVKKVPIYQKTAAIPCRGDHWSPGNFGTKLHRQVRLFFVFFENCNNCFAIVARAASRRPYGI